MRILYVHQFFRLPESGGGVRSYEFARRWVEAGHEVTMVTSDMWGEDDEVHVSVEQGIEVHWLPVRYRQEMGLRSRLGSFGAFVRQATEYCLRSLKPHDVVLASSTPLTVAIPAMAAARRWSVPFCFEVRDLWPTVPIALDALPTPLRLPAKALEHLVYRSADHVVALSPGMRRGVLAVNGDRCEVSVIPNSSDVETFDVGPDPGQAWLEAQGFDDGRPLLVYTGTFGKVNDVRWLVDLVAEMELIGDRPRLLLLGFGSEEPLIRERAQRQSSLAENNADIEAAVHIRPYVPKDEVAAILSAADLAFSTVADVPELEHNSANKVFDAFAAATPVAINHGGWLADVLEETGAGLALPYDGIEKAARIVSEFLSSPTEVRNATVAARRIARTAFDRDLHAAEYLGILESLTRHRRAPSIRFA